MHRRSAWQESSPVPVVLAALLMWVSGVHSAAAQGQLDPRVETALRGVLHREAAIRTLHGYVAEATYEAGVALPRRRFQVKFLVADGRLRYTVVGLETGPNHWDLSPGVTGLTAALPDHQGPVQGEYPRLEVARDGEFETRYENFTRRAEIKPQREAHSVAGTSPLCDVLMLASVGRPYGEFLESFTKGAEGRGPLALESGTSRGAACDVLVAPLRDPPMGNWEGRAFVAEALGWAVVRVEMALFSEAGEKLRDIVDEGVDFEKVAEGIWLPRQTLFQYYRYDLGLDNPCTEERVAVFSGLAVNEPVTDADFRVPLPPGTIVSGPADAPVPPGLADNLRDVAALRKLKMPGRDLRGEGR
jgi:hypothetical protein